MDDPLATTGDLLDRVGIPYALIGGHAVNAYVEPRVTADIDVTVVAGAAKLGRLGEALRTAGFALEREFGGESPSGADFQRWVKDRPAVVLEIQAAKTAFQRELVRRATDGKPRVASPEDLIVLKLIADRPKDQADLVGLAALPGLDWTYVTDWARAWDIEDRLTRLRSQSP